LCMHENSPNHMITYQVSVMRMDEHRCFTLVCSFVFHYLNAQSHMHLLSLVVL